MSPEVQTATAVEYAVLVPDKGYASSIFPRLELKVDPPGAGTTLEAAIEVSVHVQNGYRLLKCPEVAESVTIVSRQVTTSYGPWGAEA